MAERIVTAKENLDMVAGYDRPTVQPEPQTGITITAGSTQTGERTPYVQDRLQHLDKATEHLHQRTLELIRCIDPVLLPQEDRPESHDNTPQPNGHYPPIVFKLDEVVSGIYASIDLIEDALDRLEL